MHIQQTLATFEEFAAWLRSLQMEPAFWERSITEGKWEVRDVIAHLLHWDEYLLTHTLPAVRRGEDIQFPDFDTYNHASLCYRELSQQDVLNQAAATREQLVYELRNMQVDALCAHISVNNVSHDAHTGAPYSLLHIIDEFIHHDRHHQKQVLSVIQTA
ncbi:DinB family protein [Ectobacillus sp. JY-23]|uniref:DinB family protein n=1 Tax=Ectobacillus sp. JY-23 TaxID=2933872 RepID=UPI001FF10AC0|nr:DinB family protein [Ectobacillus sp. JY-23]UOY92567.1 DinB family protein [Ectobacillus sp. JY-23]